MDNNPTTKSLQLSIRWRSHKPTFRDRLEWVTKTLPYLLMSILSNIEGFMQFLGRIAKLFN